MLFLAYSIKMVLEIAKESTGILLVNEDHLVTKRTYMIHGHIHADTSADFWPLIQCRDHVLNAGVDLNGYRPVTFDELVENNRKFKAEHGV